MTRTNTLTKEEFNALDEKGREELLWAIRYGEIDRMFMEVEHRDGKLVLEVNILGWFDFKGKHYHLDVTGLCTGQAETEGGEG